MVKIMVVDDDPNIALLLEMTISKNKNWEVIICADGNSALKIFEKDPPNLVVLDVMMPGLDGYEVCRRIKSSEKGKFTSVILISARREMQYKIKGMDLGADDYIVKPFNPDELVSRIHVQLRIRSLEAELADKKRLEAIIAMAVTFNHEINNPLTGIVGNGEMLQEWRDMPEQEIDESIDAIVTQSRRIRDIVRKMSTISNVTESTYLNKTKMIDINAAEEEE